MSNQTMVECTTHEGELTSGAMNVYVPATILRVVAALRTAKPRSNT